MGNGCEIYICVILYIFIGIITDVSKLRAVKHLFTYECGVTWLLYVRFNRDLYVGLFCRTNTKALCA